MDGATGISLLSGWCRGFDLETGRREGAKQYLLEVSLGEVWRWLLHDTVCGAISPFVKGRS